MGPNRSEHHRSPNKATCSAESSISIHRHTVLNPILKRMLFSPILLQISPRVLGYRYIMCHFCISLCLSWAAVFCLWLGLPRPSDNSPASAEFFTFGWTAAVAAAVVAVAEGAAAVAGGPGQWGVPRRPTQRAPAVGWARFLRGKTRGQCVQQMRILREYYVFSK